jgi:homogentisate 1,2-dioxygenase
MIAPITYLSGFGNYHHTECMEGVICPGRNSPQKVPYELYAEQLSGTAFAVPGHQNLHTWLYRVDRLIIIVI